MKTNDCSALFICILNLSQTALHTPCDAHVMHVGIDTTWQMGGTKQYNNNITVSGYNWSANQRNYSTSWESIRTGKNVYQMNFDWQG